MERVKVFQRTINANKEPLFIKREWYLMDGIEMQILKMLLNGWEKSCK